jgi:ATP-dependent Lon protease
MVAPLVVGRKQSIQALEDAMEKRPRYFWLPRKRPEKTSPVPTIHTGRHPGQRHAAAQAPDGTIKALVEGKRRAEIVSYVPHDKFMQVEVQEFPIDDIVTSEVIAYERELRKFFEQYSPSTTRLPKRWSSRCKSIDNPRNFSM